MCFHVSTIMYLFGWDRQIVDLTAVIRFSCFSCFFFSFVLLLQAHCVNRQIVDLTVFCASCNSPFFAIFILLFNYVCYMCLYVISCLCVYSGLGLVVSV